MGAFQDLEGSGEPVGGDLRSALGGNAEAAVGDGEFLDDLYGDDDDVAAEPQPPTKEQTNALVRSVVERRLASLVVHPGRDALKMEEIADYAIAAGCVGDADTAAFMEKHDTEGRWGHPHNLIDRTVNAMRLARSVAAMEARGEA